MEGRVRGFNKMYPDKYSRTGTENNHENPPLYPSVRSNVKYQAQLAGKSQIHCLSLILSHR
jgi:hypothetical protein